MTERTADGPDSAAQRLFEEWLARQHERSRTGDGPAQPAPDRRATDTDDADALTALCAEHPEHAAALRTLYAEYRQLAGLLNRLGRTLPATPGAAANSGPALAERVRAQYGPGVYPDITLEPQGADAPASNFFSGVLSRLASRPDASGRYRIRGEVSRGGQGAILRVWDDDLRRHLAMKVTLGRVSPSDKPPMEPAAGSAPEPPTPVVDAHTLGRFLEEAQVTGQLDHPGIVPVHELGLDGQGRVFFTMKLVKGEDLRAVFARVHAGEAGWTTTRVLSLLLRVCEAMSFAHSKRVIHRDLKPANIMVGRYGEVFVMDWGMARVLGREDHMDIRVRPPEPPKPTEMRHERAVSVSDSPLVTMDGVAVGTPVYMPPEQASGKIERMGPTSDVYALGAMIYHLLAGQMPYVPPDGGLPGWIVLGLVLRGPPRPLRELRADVPPELEAICEKAMAREPGDRYADMSALADDLRAYLEHRVVAAYETGAVAELRKWVVRNKPLAAALAATVLAIVIGGGSFAVKAKEAADARDVVARKNAELESTNSALEQAKSEALANAERAALGEAAALENEKSAQQARTQAAEQARVATQKTNDVLSLSAIQELKELVERADALWPALPEQLAEYERWLTEAQELIEGSAEDPARGIAAHPGLRDHESKLAEIRLRAKPLTPEQTETFEFEDAQDRWWHAQLSELVANLKAFTGENTGLYSDGTSEQYGWGIAKRAEFAHSIEARSVSGAEAKRRWSEAIDAIEKSPKYGGLELTPQLGLLPIGADHESGLWEFWHVQSGDEPKRGADGKLQLTESMGVVLVLIPGGTFWMGAQTTDPAGQNYDPGAQSNERPVHEVTLSPYLLSKYELTQGQWERFTGRNPSNYPAGNRFGEHTMTRLHPVEQVTWDDAMKVLPQLGLELPTEAQWERGARGGTDTPWSTGSERDSLMGAVNLADHAAAAAGAHWEDINDWPELDDGWAAHAPVGSFQPNAFGLHDVHGNIWEWCRDGYKAAFYSQSPENDPYSDPAGARYRGVRGGSFDDAASNARSAFRGNNTPGLRGSAYGLRPARGISP